MTTLLTIDKFNELIEDPTDWTDDNFPSMVELIETGSVTVDTKEGKVILTLGISKES